MNDYLVRHDTLIEGRYAKAGDIVKLAEHKAQVYVGAGLIEGAVSADEKASAKKKG